METHDWNDAVAAYLHTACNAESLTEGEEAEIFRRHGASYDWESDPENAARRVIESHLRLVVTIAERHAASSGICVLDLIQEGNIGLFNAVKTFAKNPSGVFSAYASASIEDAISKAAGEAK
jgi:RNA polymerase primary sigma factor